MRANGDFRKCQNAGFPSVSMARRRRKQAHARNPGRFALTPQGGDARCLWMQSTGDYVTALRSTMNAWKRRGRRREDPRGSPRDKGRKEERRVSDLGAFPDLPLISGVPLLPRTPVVILSTPRLPLGR